MPRHHIMTRLARYFHVVWEDPARELRSGWLSGLGARQDVRPLSLVPGFHVHRPRLPILYRPKAAGRMMEAMRLRAALRRVKRAGARHIVLYLWRPRYQHALDVEAAAVSCYHVDDEYTFAPVERPVSDQEARLLRRADRVIIHSPGLWEKKAAIASHPAMVPNGVDYRAFAAPADEPEDLRAVPRPRIGYVGVIKQFLDIPLLAALARRHARWSFVFVGPVGSIGPDRGALDELRSLPNVFLLGMRSLERVPAYTQHLDVGMLPYDVDGYTKFIYPLKLHEYLAAGLPVVGTPIRTLQDFDTVIQVAADLDGWSAALARALSPEETAPERIATRRGVACRYDWDGIAHRVATIVADALPPGIRRAVAAAAPPPVGPCVEDDAPALGETSS